VEDNLIKLEKKVGTKGNKSGVEERAYRLPTSDMLPRERHDWYCFHCHSGGEALLCEGCHRVYHECCLKAEIAACAGLRELRDSEEGSEEEDGDEADAQPEEEDERDRSEWFCLYCKASQRLAVEPANKKARKDLNHLLRILCNKLRNRLPEKILHRESPQLVHKAVNDPNSGVSGVKHDEDDMDGGGGNGNEDGVVFKRSDKDDVWRASFLLKSQVRPSLGVQNCNVSSLEILNYGISDLSGRDGEEMH
jgi:hypothetical protein